MCFLDDAREVLDRAGGIRILYEQSSDVLSTGVDLEDITDL